MDNIPLPDLDEWPSQYDMNDEELKNHISSLEKEIDELYKDYDEKHALCKKVLMLRQHILNLRMARWNREIEFGAK